MNFKPQRTTADMKAVALFLLLASVAAAQTCPPGPICANCDQAVSAASNPATPGCPVSGVCSWLDCSGDNVSGGRCGVRGTWVCTPSASGSAARCNGTYAACPGSNSVWCACNDPSPILVDLGGEGYHLTSADDGVRFDIVGNPDDGKKIKAIAKYSWTDPNYENAWLVLDRNGNGTIDNGQEMFGNYTDQPPSDHPNGFAALAVFDKPENGGNGNGMIDPGDSVYSRLRLWVDRNHDGVSQPDELFTLNSKGIKSISLRFEESKKTDRFGNLFRYKGSIVNADESYNNRVIYDVFLTFTDLKAVKK
jgi:hypothetical protein